MQLESENIPIKCVILLISSNTWISWVNAELLCFYKSQEKVTDEPGTAISVTARSSQLFDVYGIECFFRRHLLSILGIVSTASAIPTQPLSFLDL